MKLFKWLKWLWRGKPMVHYTGYNCGCCGEWVSKPFSVRDYEAHDFYDKWGLCNDCLMFIPLYHHKLFIK